MAIVKEHLVDGVPISDLCDRHHIQPAQLYLRQKQLIENGSAAVEFLSAPALSWSRF